MVGSQSRLVGRITDSGQWKDTSGGGQEDSKCFQGFCGSEKSCVPEQRSLRGESVYYQCCSEWWILLRRGFHHKCVHTVLVVTNKRSVSHQQWGETSRQANEKAPGVAGTPSKDARMSSSKDVFGWLPNHNHAEVQE